MLDTMYTVVLRKRRNYPHFGIFVGRDFPSGLYVVTVEPNSPAAETNIQPGDRVLAINGQLISSTSENPTDLILRLSNQAESITLSLASSNTLKLAGVSSKTNVFRYISKGDGGIDPDLENFLKSLLNGNHLHRAPSFSSPNKNEYHLTPNNYPSGGRRHRKRRALKSIETQTSFTNIPQDYNEVMTRQRSIPSMGTSQVILRNSLFNSKDSGNNDVSEVQSPPSYPISITPPRQLETPILQSYNPPITPPRQLETPLLQSYNPPIPPQENFQSAPGIISVSSSPSSMHDDGLHEVHLRRQPNFRGYGFHLQYNRLYFMIHHVEPSSPANLGGLRAGDVIRRINNQNTQQMAHKTFIQIITDSAQIVLLVQPYDKFIRDNPEALNPPPELPIPSNKKNDRAPNNPLSRALAKLKSR